MDPFKAKERAKPFQTEGGEVTTLWDLIKRFLGISTNQNGTIKDAVIDVARANSISIPEWNVAGTLDSRALTPSALNALDLSSLLR